MKKLGSLKLVILLFSTYFLKALKIVLFGTYSHFWILFLLKTDLIQYYPSIEALKVFMKIILNNTNWKLQTCKKRFLSMLLSRSKRELLSNLIVELRNTNTKTNKKNSLKAIYI